MCIAIAKKKGVKVPSKETLRTCFINNNEGAGFAFANNGQVVIKKGFMDFESFYKAFNYYNEKYDFKELGLLIHFRIATHGGKNQAMTHPFPIVDDEGALGKIEYVSDYAVVHNGIISLTRNSAKRDGGLSDTAMFIQQYLTLLAKNKQWLQTESNMELIYKMIDSKMAILDRNGDIYNTNGFTEDNGVLYSNSTYKDNAYSRYYGKYDADWDYDYKFFGKNNKTNKVSNITQLALTENNVQKEIMEISQGCSIVCGQTVIYVDDSEGMVTYFTDDKGNIYFTTDGDVGRPVDFSTVLYFFVENAKILNAQNQEIEFKKTATVMIDQLVTY